MFALIIPQKFSDVLVLRGTCHPQHYAFALNVISLENFLRIFGGYPAEAKVRSPSYLLQIVRYVARGSLEHHRWRRWDTF